jgi:hypothetical protein
MATVFRTWLNIDAASVVKHAYSRAYRVPDNRVDVKGHAAGDETFQEGAMRLPRMTTRRWMVVVVIVGLLMGGVRLKERRSHLLSRAQIHKERAAFYPKLESRERQICAEYPRLIAGLKRLQRYRNREPVQSRLEDLTSLLDLSRRNLARWTNRTTYYAATAHKYQHVARDPWLPVEPDPPQPE